MASEKTLADQTFEDMRNFVCLEILEQVIGGKKCLRDAAHWIVDVTARWGKETHIRQEQIELSKRRRRRKN